MIEKEVFIHIGYPKTATTTLQEYLFPNHRELIYLRPDGKNLPFFNDIVFSRESYVKNNLSYYEKELKIRLKNDKSKYIYSEESLTSFGMYFRFYPVLYTWTIDPNTIARKLKTIFGDSGVFKKQKIIITIREQKSIIKSMYAQVYNMVFKRFRQTSSFERFLKYSFENKDQFILDTIDYNSVIKTYEELFGKENICILVFEELKQDKASFIKKLTDFMDIDYNEAIRLMENKHTNKRSSSSGVYQSDERRITEILGYYKAKLGIRSLGLANSWIFKLLDKIYIPGKKLKIEISKEYEERINELYKRGNSELSKRYDLNLKKWGYSCE